MLIESGCINKWKQTRFINIIKRLRQFFSKNCSDIQAGIAAVCPHIHTVFSWTRHGAAETWEQAEQNLLGEFKGSEFMLPAQPSDDQVWTPASVRTEIQVNRWYVFLMVIRADIDDEMDGPTCLPSSDLWPWDIFLHTTVARPVFSL